VKPSTPRSSFLGWALCFAALATLPAWPEPVGTSFHLELGAQVLTMAIFALSLQLLVGFTGLVSLGHAAYFGTAAYVVAMLAPASEAGNGWWLLLASTGGSAALALVVGLLALRTRGVYFIMVTLAFAQLAYFVVHDTDRFGGSDGAYLYFKPEFRIAGRLLFDLGQASTLYWFSLALCAFTVGALSLVLRSRLGHAFVGIRHNEQRMRAAGFRTQGYQLASFVIGGAFAGLAGFLYALRTGVVNPEILAWHQSGNALLMVILGGIGSLPGALAGAVVFVLASEWFQSLTKHWQLLLGGFVIASVALLPTGLAGGAARLRGLLRRGLARAATPAATPAPSPAPETSS